MTFVKAGCRKSAAIWAVETSRRWNIEARPDKGRNRYIQLSYRAIRLTKLDQAAVPTGGTSRRRLDGLPDQAPLCARQSRRHSGQPGTGHELSGEEGLLWRPLSAARGALDSAMKDELQSRTNRKSAASIALSALSRTCAWRQSNRLTATNTGAPFPM